MSRDVARVPGSGTTPLDAGDLFTRAVTLLPAAVRRRLDQDAPLDWAALEARDTADAVSEAARAQRRLPEPVEVLVQRLARDVGMVPADLAAGTEQQQEAGAWTRDVAIDADGESYRLQDRRTGDVRAGIRPETVAGYALFALELAAGVHDAYEFWIRLGTRSEARGGDAEPLAACADWMARRLEARAETRSRSATTQEAACALDDAWNAQSHPERAALATTPLRLPHDAHAPRRCLLAPMQSYRLHAYDPGEVRWLCALAEHIRTNTSPDVGTGSPGLARREDETAAASAPELANKLGTRHPEMVAPTARPIPNERPAPGNPSSDDDRGREGRAGAARAVMSAPEPDDLDLDRELAVLEQDAAQASGSVEATLPPDSGDSVSIEISSSQADPDDQAIGSALVALGQAAPPSLGPVEAAPVLDSGDSVSTEIASSQADPDDLAIGPALAALGQVAAPSRGPVEAAPTPDGGDAVRAETASSPADPDDLAIGPALAALGQAAPPSRGPVEAAPASDGRDAVRAETALPQADSDDLAIGPMLAALGRAAVRSVKSVGSPHVTAAVQPPDGLAAALDMATLENRIRTRSARVYDFGAGPVDPDLDAELTKLAGAAARLPAPVRRRLGDTYGISATQALTRLLSQRDADKISANIRRDNSREQAPRWLEHLAAVILRDAGAQTRDGLRTTGLHVDSGEERNGRYLVINVDDGSHGYLTVTGLVEQAHLGMTFAGNAWTGREALRMAGREGAWALQAGGSEHSGLAAGELDLLRAARQMERELRRIERAHAPANRAPTALEQAAMAVQALTAVGPTHRTTIGWPGAEAAPNPRSTDDVARVATMAGVLREHVRSISNRLIATNMNRRPGTNVRQGA